MADPQSKTENPKDGLALVVGGLFVLALVFATYNYFNGKPEEKGKSEQKQGVVNENNEEETKTLSDKLKDILNPEKEPGDLNGEGAKTTQETKETRETRTNTTPLGMGGEGPWTPKDYQKGDITGSSYQVRDGDTLWEIAEARYGNGAEWIKILQANSAQIGYLPNGQQALIFPGQTLALP